MTEQLDNKMTDTGEMPGSGAVDRTVQDLAELSPHTLTDAWIRDNPASVRHILLYFLSAKPWHIAQIPAVYVARGERASIRYGYDEMYANFILRRTGRAWVAND